MHGLPVTEKQTAYVRLLQRRLRLPDGLLDDHCVARFRHPFAECDRAEVHALLDELIAWRRLPAELERRKGQRELPGFGSPL